MAASSGNTTSIRVRKLEPWVIQTHSKIAANAGISLEEHLRRVLKECALQSQKDFASVMEKRRADIAAQFGTNFTDSVDVIRTVREDSDI